VHALLGAFCKMVLSFALLAFATFAL